MTKKSKEVDLEKIQAFDYDHDNVNLENTMSEHERELAFLGLELERERRSKKFLLIGWAALALVTLSILTMKNRSIGIMHGTYRDIDVPSITEYDDVIDQAHNVDIDNFGSDDNPNLSEEESDQLFGPSDINYQVTEEDEIEKTSEGENDIASDEIGHQVPTIDIHDLPEMLESKFGDLTEPYYPGTDLAFFWYIPKAGSTSIQEVFTQCYGLATANNFGAYSKYGVESVRQLCCIMSKLSQISLTYFFDMNLKEPASH